MDFCPYCGRDLRSVQEEMVERFLRGFEYNQELLPVLKRVRATTCNKATAYETMMLLRETAAVPVVVIERALDIYRSQADNRGRHYSSEYFRVLLSRLNDEYQANQVSIPYIGEEEVDGANSESRGSCPRVMPIGGEDT